ncbi:hypothetical protein [Brevibacterium sp. NPDC059310]|uniref:hypothetical protein n=1 Tax=Brevibacterium sp. NPDC059310 TaxID=3346802 RepID=UPI00366B3041
MHSADHSTSDRPATALRPDYRSAAARIHLAVLGVVALVLAIGTSLAFAPGGMYADTRWQLHQVLGNEQLSDWHPAIMTITWTWLFDLTGHASAILYAQVFPMFGIGLGFALYLYDVTRSRAWSYAGLGFLLLPNIFTYIGVLWKDTQMAEAFFAAVVCALLAQRFRRLRWVLLGVGLVALTYGTAVRKNAFFAVLPLIWLLAFSTWTIWSGRIARSSQRAEAETTATSAPSPAVAEAAAAESGQRAEAGRPLWRRILALPFVVLTGAVLVLVIGSGAILNAVYQPLKTHQVSQVMLDDVLFTIPAAELKTLDTDPDLRDRLVTAQAKCREAGSYEDAYWRCYGQGADGIYTAIDHTEELQDVWLSEVVTRPDRYLIYRTQTFSHFLFDNYAEWGGTIVENPMGWEVKYKQLNDAAQTYVEKFGMEDLPWLFTGWFWTLLSVVALVAHRRIRRLGEAAGWGHLSTAVTAMSLSTLIYVVGYFPIVPANHYRYVYWPAMVMTMCAIMIAAAAQMAWRAKRRRTVKVDAGAEAGRGNDDV